MIQKLIIIFSLVCSSPLIGKAGFESEFVSAYELEGFQIPALKKSRCLVCHRNQNPYFFNAYTNYYGRSIAALIKNSGQLSFKLVEPYDDDQDGFLNIEEIFVDKAPGLASSYPAGRISISYYPRNISRTSGVARADLPTGMCPNGVVFHVLRGMLVDQSGRRVNQGVARVNSYYQSNIVVANFTSKSRILVKCIESGYVGSYPQQ